mmetsp:Transcript_12515/g.30226  ORF Transcript_12515/g.30226 Transcript_12515/m.30226 type:complete len:257 (+) Transcript_12515:532-1302(+)
MRVSPALREAVFIAYKGDWVKGLCAEPRQALSVHVHTQRVAARDQRIQPQIELVPVDQERVVHVPLRHQNLSQAPQRLLDRLVPRSPRQKYPLSLAPPLRFDDEQIPFPLTAPLPSTFAGEILIIIGEDPGIREKVILVRVQLSHCREIGGKEGLATELMHLRKVVRHLVRQKPHESRPRQAPVCPVQVIVDPQPSSSFHLHRAIFSAPLAVAMPLHYLPASHLLKGSADRLVPACRQVNSQHPIGHDDGRPLSRH